MKNSVKRLTAVGAVLWSLTVMGQQTIDFSGDNTASSYKNYSQAVSVPAGSTVDVKMARYSCFTSKVTGKGTINLYAGGERSCLCDKDGKQWADWSGFKGDAHIYPFKENANSSEYNVILAFGSKKFIPTEVEECIRSGSLNNAMQNCRVTVHNGATLCNQANSGYGTGYRIGELQMEEGSVLRGYMKKERESYYLVGCLNTDATMAGTIAPSNTQTILGLIKEGTGTYRITGNGNMITGALRVLDGYLLANNDRSAAESKKLRGALGTTSSENTPIAYVFGKGVLGGTGSIGGTVDNYGTVEPGDGTPGVLTIKNYVTPTQNTNINMHPASVLRFKVASANSYDQLQVNGAVKYSTAKEDYTQGTAMPKVQVVIDENAQLAVGDELTLLTAKSKAEGDWQFELVKPEKYTWQLEERTDGGQYSLVLKLVSMETTDNPDDPETPENPETPESTMGAFYDDGISDASDKNTLEYYAKKNGKKVGVALCTYKCNDSDRKEAARQFNLMVAENEMKMDALQPSRGSFAFGGADALVTLAKNNDMDIRGHCLVWHMQQPTWLSGDAGKKNDKGWTRQQALDIMKTHINTVLQHYKGKVTEWDVVNECLDDDQSIILTNPDGYKLRPSVWQLAIGNDYIDSAFVYAHRADPSVKLFLNEYGVEMQGNAKTVAYHNLAKRLKNSKIPIDGVGLQCHFDADKLDSVKLDNNIRSFGEEGFECLVTELDIAATSTSAAGLEEQARQYRVVTDIMLNNDNCTSMIVWGIKDNDSWRSAVNPLLYNSGMQPKPAYYAVRSALRHRALQQSTAVEPLVAESGSQQYVYSLQGIRMGTNEEWNRLPQGIYVIDRKVVRKL